MSVRDEIQYCQKCPLYKNMTVSPIATEIFGENPRVLFVYMPAPNEKNDLSQEVIRGSNRAILAKICSSLQLDYAVTFLIKCTKNGNYKKSEIKNCSNHILNECRFLGIQNLVIMGVTYKEIIMETALSVESHFFTSAPNSLFNDTQQLNALHFYLKASLR